MPDNKEIQVAEKLKQVIPLCKESCKIQEAGLSTLHSINTLHDKCNKSSANRKKLNSLCLDALKDVKKQKESLLKVLSAIADVRCLEHEIKTSRGPLTLRRGILMTLLQDYAKSLTLWVGKLDEKAPPLCGAIPATSNANLTKGDHVAALVPEPDASASINGVSESWILAEVVLYQSDKKQFQVDDVDAEEGKLRYTLPASKIISLPKYKAHPHINPEAIFPLNTLVMALYPQTTCFYRAVVGATPKHVHDEYSLYFEDSTYPEGYAPAIKIQQRYVIRCPDVQENGSSRRR